jgi:hypothetical protein
MSDSVAAARSTLVAALVAAGIRCSDSPGDTAAPVVHIFGNGSDLVFRGSQLRYGFRLVLQPEGGTPAIASANLGTMVEAVVAVLRALQGWQLGDVSQDIMRSLAGSDFLSADITASTLIVI